MLLVLSLVKKCEGKAQVKHQVVLWVLRIGEDKGREERTKEIVTSQGEANQNQKLTRNARIMEREDISRNIVGWERKSKEKVIRRTHKKQM